MDDADLLRELQSEVARTQEIEKLKQIRALLKETSGIFYGMERTLTKPDEIENSPLIFVIAGEERNEVLCVPLSLILERQIKKINARIGDLIQ